MYLKCKIQNSFQSGNTKYKLHTTLLNFAVKDKTSSTTINIISGLEFSGTKGTSVSERGGQ